MILCPYCLTVCKPKLEREKDGSFVYICPNGDKIDSREYVENYNIPKITIGLVGFSGHGKTCYLTSLFYLFKYLNRRTDWFHWRTLDDNTSNIMFGHVKRFEEESQLPDSTPENFPKPALIRIGDIPFFDNYFTSFYDTAGSVYTETAKITDMGRFVAHCKVVFFVISVKDCGTSWADTMERLLDTYIRGVYDKLRVDLKKNQHLIVVLSKADEIIEFPEELKKFLSDGSYKWYLTKNPQSKNKESDIVRNKLRLLQERSRIIEGWLRLEEKVGRGFTKLAKKSFKTVDYTIVSSTGAAPVGNKLATKLEPEDPKRVLDPFFLALEKIRPKGMLERISNFFEGG